MMPAGSAVRAEPAEAEHALRQEVTAALSETPRTLPTRLLYDAHGAKLFERITTLPEYYPTRAEREILRRHAGELSDLIGTERPLVEYGPGDMAKAELLLGAFPEGRPPRAYVPVDVAVEQLGCAARRLGRRFPRMAVAPVVADFTRPFTLPAVAADRWGRVAMLLGSTLGNFHPPEAVGLLGRLATHAGPAGAVILGVDLRKDPAVLHAAYNDREGVTAAFNLNLLTRLNRELAFDFVPEYFRHYACYNPTAWRVEMHLVASRACEVGLGGGGMLRLEEGETIWTESSYKFTRTGLDVLARAAGLQLEHWWTDPRGWYGLAYLSVTSRGLGRVT